MLTPLLLSLKISVLSSIFTFFTGILAAWGVVRLPERAQSFFDGVLTLPLVLPPTVVGFFLLLLFGKNSALGQALLSAGVRVVFSQTGAVLAAFVVSFPLMYRTTKSAFELLDPNILDAARTLGMGEFEIFRRLMIPLSLPGIGSGTVLAFARALGEFGATLMIAGNIPGKTQTISLMIYTASAAGDMALAMKWVMVIVVLSLGSVYAMDVFIKRHSTSAKRRAQK